MPENERFTIIDLMKQLVYFKALTELVKTIDDKLHAKAGEPKTTKKIKIEWITFLRSAKSGVRPAVFKISKSYIWIC